jgi:hypothetical protein
MNETVRNRQTADQSITPLLTERLEQLGYQCLADKCEQFTTLRLIPLETKRKEELCISPTE